jgi:hypothetical protein
MDILTRINFHTNFDAHTSLSDKYSGKRPVHINKENFKNATALQDTVFPFVPRTFKLLGHSHPVWLLKVKGDINLN